MSSIKKKILLFNFILFCFIKAESIISNEKLTNKLEEKIMPEKKSLDSHEKILLSNEIKLLKLENKNIKEKNIKIEEEIKELKEKQRKEIKQEFNDQGLSIAYNIDQIYKNANEYYEGAFNHLKWIVGFLGSLIVLAQYLFRKSEKKELDDIRAQITNRIDNFENSIIEKAQEKSQNFFIEEEEKLKKEIEEIRNSQELELKKLKEYNLKQEFQLEYIKAISFNQGIDTRVKQLEDLLYEEKYKEFDKENVLYQLKEEYDAGLYLYEEYKDRCLKLYEDILILEKSKENNDKKIKKVLDDYFNIILFQDEIYLLKKILKEESQYLTADQNQRFSLIVAVKHRDEAAIMSILKTDIKTENISFNENDINYIISILDPNIYFEIIKKLEDRKKGDEQWQV